MQHKGEDVVDAMEMARDAIGLMGIDLMDDGKLIPEPNSVKFDTKEGDIATLVDVDFVEYRKKVDNKAVKKNCTIPYWMSVEAEKVGINYSKLFARCNCESAWNNKNMLTDYLVENLREASSGVLFSCKKSVSWI